MLVINGQELFNYAQIAEELKISINGVHVKARRRGIKPVFYKINKGYKTGYFTREQIDLLKVKEKTGRKEKPKAERPKKKSGRRIKNYWKLSVYNDDIGVYVIKNCCLSHEEANAKKKELEAEGFEVRISKHTETVDRHGKIHKNGAQKWT